MLIGELEAPGAETVTELEYVPTDIPDEFTAMLKVPGVKELEAVTVIQEALADAAQVVLAPAAVTLTDCGGGTVAVPALNIKLDGLKGSRATWPWTAETWMLEYEIGWLSASRHTNPFAYVLSFALIRNKPSQ